LHFAEEKWAHSPEMHYVTISAVIVPTAALRFAVKVCFVAEKINSLVIESESRVSHRS